MDLGDFLGCAAPGCVQGEWSAKAIDRGWSRIPGTEKFLCGAHGNTRTYVDEVRNDLTALLPDCDENLMDLYALLVFVRGTEVKLEDVHDAWALWRRRTDPHHRSIVPFGELTEEVQNLDLKYAEAIFKVARYRCTGNDSCSCECEGCRHHCGAHQGICRAHPDAPVIGGRCGLCTVVPS